MTRFTNLNIFKRLDKELDHNNTSLRALLSASRKTNLYGNHYYHRLPPRLSLYNPGA